MSTRWQTVRWSSRVPQPWKNGGGVTTQLLAYPADAGLDGFDWRLSVAQVSTDGPFSHFAGVDRTLVLLEGAGMELAVDGVSTILTARQRLAVFSGDAATQGRLLDGPIRDLNIMTRRDGWRHRASLVGPGSLQTRAPSWLLVCLAAERATITLKEQPVGLATYDTVLGDGAVENASTDGLCCLIELWPLTRPETSLDSYV